MKATCPNYECGQPVKRTHCRKCGLSNEWGNLVWRCPDCFTVHQPFPTSCQCGYNFILGQSAWRKSVLLPSPYPYYGAKGYEEVIEPAADHFAECGAYVEPFMGSAAMLLNLPSTITNKFANDRNGFICNFWRAVKHDPQTVAEFMDWPANETDMHARHDWLVHPDRKLLAKLSADPEWHDPKVAGWWAYGQVLFIGNGWCQSAGQNGRPPRGSYDKSARIGVRIKPDLDGFPASRRTTRAFMEADRTSPNRWAKGNRKMGISARLTTSLDYLEVLSARLRDCRIYCKHLDSRNRRDDWLRLCCDATFLRGRGRPVAVFIDPPYADTTRQEFTYGRDDTHENAQQLRRMLLNWCKFRGDDPRFRIVVCGYEGEYNELEAEGWSKIAWTGRRGQGGDDNLNRFKERLWLNPS